MPTARVHDTAGQEFNEPPVVELAGDDSQLGPPTMGDTEDEARREAAYGTPQEAAAAASDATASEPEPGFSSEQVSALNRLRQLGSRRVALRAELEAVETELLGDAIEAAFRLKVPKRVIARESQVARQTVYNALERKAN